MKTIDIAIGVYFLGFFRFASIPDVI